MLRVLLLGSAGQVGRELAALLPQFAQVLAPARATLPMEDLDGLRRLVRDHRPEVIVNATSWNDVDGAERDEAGAMRVNRDAVALLGEEARASGGALIHYSTDFVFDGHKGAPYVESDPVSPLSAYGRSKVAGEQALQALDAPALVLRTAWVLKGARQHEQLRIVDDQIGNPTFARDLAVATALILRGAGREGAEVARTLREARGLYHATGTGSVSRFELAEEALRLDPRRDEHRLQRLVAVKTPDLKLPAPRPGTVELDGHKLFERFGLRLPPWQDALARALAELAPLLPPSS